MPLHSEHESVLATLDSFHQTIGCNSIDHESFAGKLDCLVMRRVYLEPVIAYDPVKLCPGSDRDHVSAHFSASALLVLVRAGDLSANVLIERAAEAHVDRLSSAADSQDRHILIESVAGQVQFKICSLRPDFTKLLERLFAVVARMNIEVPTAQDDAVEALDVLSAD